jgi:hypothetical protein
MRRLLSFARRLRWLLFCLGPLAVLTGVAGWLLCSTDPIGPRAFERIELGMNEEDVSTIIGLPPGSYVSERVASAYDFCKYFAVRVDEKGCPFPEARQLSSRDWYGERHWIKVVFDEEGRVVGVYLYDIPEFSRSYLDDLRTRMHL